MVQQCYWYTWNYTNHRTDFRLLLVTILWFIFNCNYSQHRSTYYQLLKIWMWWGYKNSITHINHVAMSLLAIVVSSTEGDLTSAIQLMMYLFRSQWVADILQSKGRWLKEDLGGFMWKGVTLIWYCPSQELCRVFISHNGELTLFEIRSLEYGIVQLKQSITFVLCLVTTFQLPSPFKHCICTENQYLFQSCPWACDLSLSLDLDRKL